MKDGVIRAAEPGDLDALAKLEKKHFPAKPGQRHSGYVFADQALAPAILDRRRGGARRFFVAVAEVGGSVVGFATAMPFTLPGVGAPDPANMLLQFVAVEEEHRRRGFGRRLVSHVEELARPHRQIVMVAHIPASESEFYRRLGWLVMAPGAGFAWLPFNEMLRADLPDPDVGYEHMAAKLLRPKSVRRWFGFPFLTGAPLADASVILEALVSRGDIDVRDLDKTTAEMLAMNRAISGAQPPSKNSSAFHRPRA